MWHKTLAGLICGLSVLLLVPTGISLLFPAYTAVMISLAILVFTPAWAGIMVYCYAASSHKQAWQRGSVFLISSLLFFTAAYYFN